MTRSQAVAIVATDRLFDSLPVLSEIRGWPRDDAVETCRAIIEMVACEYGLYPDEWD